jgi:hypothetical protein
MKTLTKANRTRIVMILAALVMSGVTLSGAEAYQEAGAYVPCDYPNGWNSTDASHELEGTPDGDHHQCWVAGRTATLVPSAVWGGSAGLASYNDAR